MAYVPDDRMRRKREVSRSAWDVYEALCAFADSDTGIVEPYHFSYAKLVEWSGVALGTARNAMIELRKKGWKMEDGAGRIHLAGVFVIEAKRLAEERKRKAKKAAAMPEQPSLLDDAPSPASDKTSPASDTAPLANDTASLASDARIDKERARGSTNPDQPLTNPTSPHTPAPAAPVAKAPPPGGGGGCVSMPKSRHRKEQCIAWAEQRKAEGAKIDPYAVGRARWMDGTADDEVGDFLARRAAIAEGKRPVTQERMPYHVAAAMVNSVKQRGGDVTAYIANELPRVTPEDKQRLVERFAPAVAARAHAPP
ncbi:MAG: hypothetical protein LC795_15535 [Acidobacteria bacterium]|nr:hypothetical protein [Acidobacteriota bacterium]MCA1620687.1 hypothetical protein [Acidobacteriota bacterium]